MLFNIYTADVMKIVKEDSKTIMIYSDDMIIGLPSKEVVQMVVNNLQKWAFSESE